MPGQTLVDATDLNLWSNRNTAASVLPQLLRRLVIATADAVTAVGFRAGDGVAIGGWDGRVEAVVGNAFVPEGVSVWELGTNRGVKGKADEDYDKRKDDPKECVPAETAYIFVTSRRWGGKDDWVTARQAEGFWKEVRAYDADDLEAWLEQSPHVHVWFSILLGKRPEAATDVAHYWSDWSGVTNPVLSPELVVSGRSDVFQELSAWLNREPSTLGFPANAVVLPPSQTARRMRNGVARAVGRATRQLQTVVADAVDRFAAEPGDARRSRVVRIAETERQPPVARACVRCLKAQPQCCSKPGCGCARERQRLLPQIRRIEKQLNPLESKI